MRRATALRVVRASAIYDVIVTGGFSLPWTLGPAIGLLQTVHERLGLSGAPPAADDVFTALYANLLGSVVLIWSLVRVYRPSLLLGAADTITRALFMLGMSAALLDGVSQVVVGFLVLETAWFLAQGSAVALAVRAGRKAPTLRR